MSYIFYIEMFSKKKVDTFEYKTDVSCISHGLGYQLLDWSITVLNSLKSINWRGANNLLQKDIKERYLNPETIEQFMRKSPIQQPPN